MTADRDVVIRKVEHLVAQRMVMVRTLEALRWNMEQRLVDSEARLVRTTQLLAASATLLQQSKIPRTTADHTPPDPRG